MASARVLTDEQVRLLRKARGGPVSISQLCREMGINRNTAMNVVNGSCYRDVPDEAPPVPEHASEPESAPRPVSRQHAGSIFKLAQQPDLYRLLMSSRSYMRHL